MTRFIQKNSSLWIFMILLGINLVSCAIYPQPNASTTAKKEVNQEDLFRDEIVSLAKTYKGSRFYEQHPRWYFLPVYFTLAFPTLLFYYVKFNLYPVYRLQLTDIKHFILPIGQWLFFAILFCMPVEYKSGIDRHFYNPFYGAFEQGLYLVTFFAYIYFAYRYVRHKRRRVRDPRERKKVIYLAKLLQILFVLFCGHTVFVVGDFLSYEILGINLRAFKPHLALGMLSFAVLVFWLGIYGVQVLLWGRRIFLLPKQK